MSSTGPSVQARCRVLNQSSCGSGSHCGFRGDKGLFLTNAHVAGSRIGRVVNIELGHLGMKRLQARVILAAYSDRYLADWAILETVNPFQEAIKPVRLSKNRPKMSDSYYTRGYPRCRTHDGTDIRPTHIDPTTPLMRWQPDAIGGQSGSGVWSDRNNLQYALLTWSWGNDGAGQMTSEIYRQARNRSVVGYERPEGLIELNHDFDMASIDTSGIMDDPEVRNGIYFDERASSIADLDIWYDPTAPDPDPDPEPGPGPSDPEFALELMIEDTRKHKEFYEKRLLELQGVESPITKPDDPEVIGPGGGGMFGLDLPGG